MILRERFLSIKTMEPRAWQAKKKPVELVYCQKYNQIDVALYVEKQVQKWSKKEKEELINGQFDKLSELSKNYSQFKFAGEDDFTSTTNSNKANDSALINTKTEVKKIKKSVNGNTDYPKSRMENDLPDQTSKPKLLNNSMSKALIKSKHMSSTKPASEQAITKITRIMTLILFIILLNLLLPGNLLIARNNNPLPSSSLKKQIQILLVTGGSKAAPDAFLDIFFSMPGIKVDTLGQPRANEALLSDSIKKYHTLVFYDMNQNITEQQKVAFLKLTKSGTGLVFLHHSLVSYQEWDEFKKIVGGKYYERRFNYPPERVSDYKHDLVLDVKVLNRRHPVIRGITDFTILDEGYSNTEILPGITPLLTVDHPDCTDIIAWTNSYQKSKVVYLLLGHDDHAYNNQNYRKLVHNAILWSSKK